MIRLKCEIISSCLIFSSTGAHKVNPKKPAEDPFLKYIFFYDVCSSGSTPKPNPVIEILPLTLAGPF